MICKRIRLSERRMKPLPEIREGPIIRPCTHNLVNQTTTATSPRAKRVTIQEPLHNEHFEGVAETGENTPTASPSNHQPTKTPLIVLTLSMPPETETLAPKIIKRDPRKQPSFCIQYSTQTKILNNNKRVFESQLPEIYIQGVELIEPKPDEQELLTDRSNSSKSSELESMINHPNDHQNGLDFFDSEREFLLNFDGYDLDVNGGIPGDTRTPTPTSNGIRSWCLRRTPSPTTRQVIRVDVSLNKKNMKKKIEKL